MIRTLAAVALGIGIGYVLFHEDATTPRAIREAPQTEITPRVVETPPPQQEGEPNAESTLAAPPQAHGRVEVVNGDTWWLDVIGASVETAGFEATFEEHDGVGFLDLRPGVYVLRCRTPGGQAPRMIPVRIEAGRTTRVDLATPPTPEEFPIPQGHGLLELVVYGLDGAPMPGAPVQAGGAKHRCDANGWRRADVEPGEVLVSVGSREQRVVVHEGQRATLEFRYAGEGEIAVEGVARKLVLRRPGESWREHWQVGDRLVYVPPGTWEVGWNNGARRAGVVDVVSGSRVVLRVNPPPGGLRVVSAHPNPPQHCTVRVEGLTPGADPGESESWWAPYFDAPALAPGRYRVTVTAPGYHAVGREVEVRDEIVTVDVPFVKAE